MRQFILYVSIFVCQTASYVTNLNVHFVCVCLSLWATEPPQDHKTAHLCFSLCPFFVSLFFSCLASFYIFLRLSSEFRILTCELRSPTLQVAALFFWWWIGAGGGGWCHTVNWKWKTVMQIRRTTTKNPNRHQQLSQKESGISKEDGFIESLCLCVTVPACFWTFSLLRQYVKQNYQRKQSDMKWPPIFLLHLLYLIFPFGLVTEEWTVSLDHRLTQVCCLRDNSQVNVGPLECQSYLHTQDSVWWQLWSRLSSEPTIPPLLSVWETPSSLFSFSSHFLLCLPLSVPKCFKLLRLCGS